MNYSTWNCHILKAAPSCWVSPRLGMPALCLSLDGAFPMTLARTEVLRCFCLLLFVFFVQRDSLHGPKNLPGMAGICDTGGLWPCSPFSAPVAGEDQTNTISQMLWSTVTSAGLCWEKMGFLSLMRKAPRLSDIFLNRGPKDQLQVYGVKADVLGDW